MRCLRFAAAAALLVATPTMAQTPGVDQVTPPLSTPAASVAPTSPIEPAAPAPATIRIPAGTVIQVEITEALSSKTSQQEQLFGLRLAEPIVIDGREIVPAGALGGGEVIDALPAGASGRRGRLIVSGRFIELDGEPVRIRGMQLLVAGADRTQDAMNAGLAGAIVAGPIGAFAGFLVRGGEIEIPAGARGAARLAVDVDVPMTLSAAVEPVVAEQSESAQTGENQQ